MNRQFSLLVVFGLVVAMAPAGATENTDMAAPMPPCETSLLDVGTRQIFWQSYDKEPVPMLLGGENMESASGAAFQDQGYLLGRRCLFMHSAMIRREPDRLVLYPYPRERRFLVSLDVKTLAPAANLAHLQVRALAAGDGCDLGPVAAVRENGRLVLTVGMPGAGRYVIGWKSR